MPRKENVFAPSCRPARLDDLDALMALEQESFKGDRMSQRQMRYHLQSKKAEIWVCADETDKPVACLLAFFPTGRAPRIYSLATAARARGQGLGEILVRRFLEEARRRKASKALLEVRTDSAAAIRLYEKLGFYAVRSLPGYYEDGCEGIKMMVNL